MLLDEGRLAGRGQGHRRRAPTAATTSTRTSTPTRSSTPSTTARKLFLEGRNIAGCHNEFASYAHGSKGSAVISTSAHSPAKCRIYKGQKIDDKDSLIWAFPQPEPNPYQLEWDDLIDAIRKDKPYNEVKRGVRGQPRHLDGPHGRPHRPGHHLRRDAQLQPRVRPEVAKLTLDGPAPLQADDDGTYPLPQPGKKRKREY